MTELNIPFLFVYVVRGLLIALIVSGPIFLILLVARLVKRQQAAAAAAQEQVHLQREVLATLQQVLAEQRETNRQLDRLSRGGPSQ